MPWAEFFRGEEMGFKKGQKKREKGFRRGSELNESVLKWKPGDLTKIPVSLLPSKGLQSAGASNLWCPGQGAYQF